MNLRTIIFMVLSLISFATSAQDSAFHRPGFQTKTSLVYYYFWEENDDGSISPSCIYTPFSLNRVVLIDPVKSSKTCKLSDSLFMHEVESVGRSYQQNKAVFTKHKQHHTFRFNVSWPEKPQTVVYIKRKGQWASYPMSLVLYFDADESGNTRFKQAASEIYFGTNPGIPIVYSTYRVYSFFQHDHPEKTKPVYQHLLAFTGEELSAQLTGNLIPEAKRYLVFVNGYRGPKFDKEESRNEVYMNDRTNYWFKIDDRFIQRLHPDTSFYLDGSFSVKTSNHYSKLKFGWSYIRSIHAKPGKKSARKYSRLNQKSNTAGFDYRYQKGITAGKAFLNQIQNTPKSYLVKDTIDLVCHSMGYAYTLGLIETIKEHVVLGKIYLIAPENGGYKGMDWNLFEEAWQYGANLGEKIQDPLSYQDGVAPQTAVYGILAQQSAHVGRIFSPAGWPNKHFVHSHMVYSYDWMFDRIQKGQAGYIH
ncbi:hypothetical protein [Fluviicola sp.]|uniref:hypothetical protein n=1 Tax=Fluviicola sp. TaxID=1917219 RepID=UPI0031E2AD8F